MKIRFLVAGLVFFTGVLHAQEPADALRFSWTVPGGTARHQAIGGAMGSLGGDITATFVNPAGLAFYRTGDVVLTPRFQFGNNRATYLSNTEKESSNKFTWGTSGFVAGSGSNRKGRNVAISLAYNRSADFNSNVFYQGGNSRTSFSQRYLEELANSGVRDSSAAFKFPLGPSLAINTYWIDPVKNSDGQVTGFETNAPLATGVNQEHQIESRGGIDEFALGVGVSASDKLMLGGTIGVPVLHYRKETRFVEEDVLDDPTNGFDFASIEDKLNTKGVGINAKLGLIYKPVEYVRLGLAFHTPTVYTLDDNYEVALTTSTEGSQGMLTDYSADYNDDQPNRTSYLLVTPYRAIVSASYVLREIEDVTRQRGFITADIEYVNYKAAAFHTDEEETGFSDNLAEDYFKNLNTAIDNAYRSTFNFRVGGELKFTTLMVRAGAAYYGNPYKNINGEKGSRMNLSGGLGYRNKGLFIDLTYVHALARDVHFAYRLQNTAYEGARIRSGTGNVLATFGFKF